jgi:hypothetical protein
MASRLSSTHDSLRFRRMTAASQPSSPRPVEVREPRACRRREADKSVPPAGGAACSAWLAPQGKGVTRVASADDPSADSQRVCFVASHRDADKVHVVGVGGATLLRVAGQSVGDRGVRPDRRRPAVRCC